ncbi:DUF1566 domain-containing protein [bacterium]|nr:DUF1566 domain-containing protein [bacterium]
MKKILVISLVFATVFLIVSCGGSTQNKSEASGNGEKPDSDEQDSEADGSAECKSGDFKCADSESLYCNSFGSWVFYARCENGCDSATGKCKDMCYEIDNKTWSYSRSSMTWEAAKEFCDNMINCGYSDWHLPTISELRTLIQNCPATETGGECGVTDQCLSYHQCSYIHNDDNSIISLCIGCSDSDSYYSGKYSKFGDNDWFWSSSFQDDTDSIQVWGVYFAMGTITSFGTNEYTLESVRCVR